MGDSLIDARRHSVAGAHVGPIALGCARWPTQTVGALTALLNVAVSLGISLVDTADVYGADTAVRAEELLGDVLGTSRSLREHVVIATKAGVVPGVPYDSSYRHLLHSCDVSLRRLRVDAIDLFQVHRPDIFTHPDETAAALTRILDDGKARAVGVSNHTPAQLEALIARLPGRLASTSPELSLLALAPVHDGTLDHAVRIDLTLLAWSPLAGGRLATGNGLCPALLAELDRLADREQVDRAAIALGFLLALPAHVVPIVGTTKPERLEGAARAASVHLDRADLYCLMQAAEGIRLP